MIRDGSMPSLETLLEAIAEAREKYAQQIKASRKPSKSGYRASRRGKLKGGPAGGRLSELKTTGEDCTIAADMIEVTDAI
jgi:hypothetical protein